MIGKPEKVGQLENITNCYAQILLRWLPRTWVLWSGARFTKNVTICQAYDKCWA